MKFSNPKFRLNPSKIASLLRELEILEFQLHGSLVERAEDVEFTIQSCKMI